MIRSTARFPKGRYFLTRLARRHGNIYIGGVRLKVEVEAYLTAKGLRQVVMVGDNAMACCPFHNEAKPSFGVNVDTGVYNCFGCGAKGTFALLVKHLEKHDTVWDAERSIVSRFAVYAVKVDEPLNLDFGDTKPQVWMEESLLVDLRYRHPYLESRGISDLWQRRFEIGYDTKKQAVTFPWRDAGGHLVTIKYRSVVRKDFWYAGVGKKADHLYGLHHVKRRKDKVVCVTESETDCIYLWQCGFPAVALGGSALSNAQAHLLLNSPVEKIVVFTDNDAAGEKARAQLARALSGHKHMFGVDWSMFPIFKDANELKPFQVGMLVDESIPLNMGLVVNAGAL